MELYTRQMKRLALTIATASLFSSPLSAEEAEQKLRVPTEELVEGIKSSDGRWFEVEVIIFAHNRKEETREAFDDEINNLAITRSWDRLTNYLYPDTHLLKSALPNCWQEKDPFYKKENQFQPEKSPALFYMQYQTYKKLLTQEWQISDQLCLLPSESQTPYWQVSYPVNYLSDQDQQRVSYEQMPVTIGAADYDDFSDVYLLAESNLQLREQFEQIMRNRNTRPLIHMGWRLPGQAERVTKPLLIQAGKNFSDGFYYDGTARPVEQLNKDIESIETSPENESLLAENNAQPQSVLEQDERSAVDRFMEKLEQGAVVDFQNKTLIEAVDNDYPDETWELDGYIKVHLNHYLFLDAELNFREKQSLEVSPEDYLNEESSLLLDKTISTELTSDGGPVIISAIKRDEELTHSSLTENDKVTVEYLKIYPLKQKRRTYSGDLHYLDHPKLGILFQIRKYRH